MIKLTAALVFSLFVFWGCSKEEKAPQTQQKDQSVQQDDSDNNPTDTNLTPEEKFSSALMFDLIGDTDEDDDLADYLENTVYRMSLSYTGVSMAEISPSAWLLMFEKDGKVKNYLLQKFIDVRSNDAYFRLTETNLTITDVIISSKDKGPGGQ